MKQALSVLVLFLFIVALVLNQALPADAAKKTVQKKGVSQEFIQDMTTKVDNLTKKIYEKELYTPSDANQLIGLKLQLDEQMDILSEASFAPLYYKIGNIYRLRGQEKEAISCYQTILENFSETAYGPKARDILTEMGVEIRVPVDDSEEDDSFSDEEF